MVRKLVAIFAAAASSFAAVAQPVEPKQKILTGLLEVAAPGMEGWRIDQQTPARVTFSRVGFGPHGTLAAIAIVFRIDPPRSKEHFLEQIRAGVEADTPADRYRELRSALRYEEDRGYPCVGYTAVHEDLKARTTTPATQLLQMQNRSLYCLHPAQPGAAFVAGFSHRGESLYSDLDAAAKEFIDGVRPRAK